MKFYLLKSNIKLFENFNKLKIVKYEKKNLKKFIFDSFIFLYYKNLD